MHPSDKDALDESLSPQERKALEAWQVSAPPEGQIDAVLDQFDQETISAAVGEPIRLHQRTPVFAYLSLVLMAVMLFQQVGFAWPHTGELSTKKRFSQKLSPSTQAVLEPEAQLEWETSLFGELSVFQKNGSVFYRVEPGSQVKISTEAGTILVKGTCFKVETQKMTPVKSSLLGAAAGADRQHPA